jgi:ubiquitin C-terminal hydrolase
MINYNNNNNNQNELKNEILNKNNNEKKEDLTQYSFYKNNNKFPKIGLINLGHTSYLNVVIQALVNIEDLALYFLDYDKMNYLDSVKEEFPLSYEIKEIFCHLYPPKEELNENQFAPLSLLDYFQKDNKNRYSFNKRANPIYLLKDLLNGLDSELNTLSNKNIEENSNKSDREDTIYSGMKYIIETNDSPIFRIFCYTKINESICEKCCNNVYDLKNCNSFKLNISGCYSSKKEKITIKDCLKYHAEEPQKNYLLFCHNCQRKRRFYLYSKIYRSPNIFIFLIDRGIEFNEQKNESLKIPLIIEDQLDLEKFIEYKDIPTKYELIGIVSILIKDNKYVSMCKSPIDNNWYNYNDEEVQKIEHKKVIEQCNNYNMYSPCIVIYKAANGNNNK